MPLTAAIFKQAFETSHDACKASGCIHAAALSESFSEMLEAIDRCLDSSINPEVSIFVHGLHIGYRAAELVAADPTPTPKEKIN